MNFKKWLILISMLIFSSNSLGLTINSGSAAIPEWCSDDVSHCYLTYRNSKDESNRIKGVLFYLQYLSLLESKFDLEGVLADLDKMIDGGNTQAMLVKASIYSSDYYVDKDYELVIDVLEGALALGEGNKSLFSLLGGAYANLFLSNTTEISNYHYAKLYLAKAYKLGNYSVAFEMGYLLLTYGNEEDFFEAEEYIHYMYLNGSEDDKERFYGYLELKNQMMEKN